MPHHASRVRGVASLEIRFSRLLVLTSQLAMKYHWNFAFVLWKNVFFREIVLVLLGAMVVFSLGFWFGKALESLYVVTLAYLGWHLFQLHKLRTWLYDPKVSSSPKFMGVWREVLNDIEVQLHLSDGQAGRKRKPKLDWIVKRFNKSISALPDAAILFGPNDEIEWWNLAADELFGLRKDRDKGKPITHLIHHPAFVRQLREEKIWRKPLEISSPVDTDIWLMIVVVPAGKSRRLLQARDSTRLHRLEQVRRDFVANVSHELRTPLTVINGYVETLLDHDDTKSFSWYPVLSKIHQQAGRMGKIVEDLLLLSRLEIGTEQPRQEHVSVATLLESIREDALVLSSRARHRITITADPELGIMGNAWELRSAFSNLVFNAIRYTAAEGEIIVRWYGDDKGGHLLVHDTGIGIEPQHLPRITERFYRVDTGRSRETGGTGLGLTIVKHVLIQHGAKLSVESTPGQSSVFGCHFPPVRLFRDNDPNSL
uniref:Phosphate regulon sensor protein PhoR n=1 Tax=Candidatus Kentrum sp. TUN TaxID=2126343 RepID=A0A450ZVW7_9GAMM|nr:MAG: two-component system, OmpR family, phosphate regulon sensor histidine kinase PhoR [Candidatus Kentron sp. TUN]VFK67026.1 MAG: two-component system, OmpR family, phosphate regulon sensor histidine kinase PhoR [Candidatus Kentron sp. TUN]